MWYDKPEHKLLRQRAGGEWLMNQKPQQAPVSPFNPNPLVNPTPQEGVFNPYPQIGNNDIRNSPIQLNADGTMASIYQANMNKKEDEDAPKRIMTPEELEANMRMIQKFDEVAKRGYTHTAYEPDLLAESLRQAGDQGNG